MSLAFEPRVVGEEAGVSLFLQRGMRFDLGIVGVASGGVNLNTSGGGNADRSVNSVLQFRAITATSSPDGFRDRDPLTIPGAVLLSEDASVFGLRLRAVNASLYEFGFRYEGGGKEEKWTTVGYGAAREVSGGFTGVSNRCFLRIGQLCASLIDVSKSLFSGVCRRSLGCMPPETVTTPRHQPISRILSTMLYPEFSDIIGHSILHAFELILRERAQYDTG